jgi:prevent-host-death family protein
MTITRIKSGDARTNWREMIDQVLIGRSDIMIERNGKDVAVLIPAGDYQEIKEDLEDLRAERRAALAYAEWKQDAKVAGPWVVIEGEILGKPNK